MVRLGKTTVVIWSNPPCSSRVIPEDMTQDGVQTVLWIYPVRGTLPWACIWASFYLWVFTCIISVLSFTAHVSPAAYNCCLPSILSIDKNSLHFLNPFSLLSLPAIQGAQLLRGRIVPHDFLANKIRRVYLIFLRQMHFNLILYCEYNTSAQIFLLWIHLARHKMPAMHQTSAALIYIYNMLSFHIHWILWLC